MEIGDERDIDFETGCPIDEVPFEIEGDDQAHQRMLMRVDWKSWKYFVGLSIVHPIWGKGTIIKYVKEKSENTIWSKICFIANFEEQGEKRFSLNTLVESLKKHN